MIKKSKLRVISDFGWIKKYMGSRIVVFVACIATRGGSKKFSRGGGGGGSVSHQLWHEKGAQNFFSPPPFWSVKLGWRGRFKKQERQPFIGAKLKTYSCQIAKSTFEVKDLFIVYLSFIVDQRTF